MMSNFHQSSAWQRLAKRHKQLTCDDCGSVKDIQSGHILPQKRFPMSRLWMINLKYLCAVCNVKQSDKLQINIRTLQLLGIYYMIKIVRWVVLVIVIGLMSRFIYLDVANNDSAITNQMRYDLIKYWDKLKGLTS